MVVDGASQRGTSSNIREAANKRMAVEEVVVRDMPGMPAWEAAWRQEKRSQGIEEYPGASAVVPADTCNEETARLIIETA